MKRRGEPSEDDRLLFRESVGRVRPLTRAAAPPARTPPAPEPLQSLKDEANVSGELLHHAFDPAAIEVGDELTWLQPGQSPLLLKRLRRGEFSVRAEIDLHEMTAAVAHAAIDAFLDDCHRHGERCVKIIHGKGLRSRAAGPVLKRLTDRLLRRRKDVLAYASARPSQGGTGAVIVLLARA